MRIVLFANTDWYLYNFRLSLAKYLVAEGHSVLLVSPSGAHASKISSEGLTWIEAPMSRSGLNLIREIYFLWWFRSFLINKKVDLVHGFTIKSVILGGLVSRYLGIPRVNSVAGLGYIFVSKDCLAKILKPIILALMSWVINGQRAYTILQNREDFLFLKKAFVSKSSKLRLIAGSGVNTEHFSPGLAVRSKFELSKNDFVVLMPARMLWNKGVSEFIYAAKHFKNIGVNCSFVLAGSPDIGNPSSVPASFLQHENKKGFIRWIGHIEDMANLYRSVDLVVLPTYYGEGLPKSLLEAAACSLPIITTNSPGCSDIVINNINGLLVPSRDVEALILAIEKIYLDVDLRVRFGRAGRERVLNCFDEKIVLKKTIKLYEDLVPL